MLQIYALSNLYATSPFKNPSSARLKLHKIFLNLINFLNAFFEEVGIEQISNLTFTNKERQGQISIMLEKWVYLFNNLTELKDRPQVLEDKVFDPVLSAAEYAALSEEDRQIYDKAIMTELDYQGALEYAAQEGREEGVEEGRLQQQLKVLRNMLAMNMDDEQIRGLLGVDQDELNHLKGQL